MAVRYEGHYDNRQGGSSGKGILTSKELRQGVMYVRGAITNIPLSNNNLAAMHNKSTSVGALGSTEEIVKPLVESKTEEGPTAKVDPCPGGRLTNCGPSYRPTNSSVLFMSLMTAPLGLGPARTPCVKAHN